MIGKLTKFVADETQLIAKRLQSLAAANMLISYLHNSVSFRPNYDHKIRAIVPVQVAELDALVILMSSDEDASELVGDLETNAHMTHIDKLCVIGTGNIEVPYFSGRTNDFGEFPSFYVMGLDTYDAFPRKPMSIKF